MTAARSYVTILFALFIGGGYAAAAPGCVIQATDCDECDEEGVCHSHLGSDGECYCDAGYEWSDPGDSNSYDCDRIPPKPLDNNCNNPHNVTVGDECFCACGYTWCSDAADDLSCCADDSSDCAESSTDPLETGGSESGGSGTGTGTGTGGSSESGSSGGSGGSSESGMADSSSEGSGSSSGSESGSGSGG